jgi:RNA polymerase sigma factor for flagellar operon FliA
MTNQSPTLDRLIEESQGLVRSLASRIHRKGPPNVDLEDMIAYGQIGLAEAAHDFDPSRGNQFSTYAYYRIRGAIYDGLAKMSWFGRAQYQQARYDRMANETLRASNEEAAPATPGDKESNARWFRNLSWNLMVVYLAANSRTNEEDEEMILEDKSALPPPSVLIGREITQKLHDLINTLPATEANLIRATYFEGLTLQEAGEKMGFSKSWASRLHAKTLQRLARSLKQAGLAS